MHILTQNAVSLFIMNLTQNGFSNTMILHFKIKKLKRKLNKSNPSDLLKTMVNFVCNNMVIDYILYPEWSDEFIDLTTMSIFFFLCTRPKKKKMPQSSTSRVVSGIKLNLVGT